MCFVREGKSPSRSLPLLFPPHLPFLYTRVRAGGGFSLGLSWLGALSQEGGGMGGLSRRRGDRWTARTAVGGAASWFPACGPRPAGLRRLPQEGQSRGGKGWRLASSLSAHHHLLFLGLGWRRLEYFMQKVMANEVSTARPGKKRGMKGRARLTDLRSLRRSVFSSVFQLPGSTSSGKYLNL